MTHQEEHDFHARPEKARSTSQRNQLPSLSLGFSQSRDSPSHLGALVPSDRSGQLVGEDPMASAMAAFTASAVPPPGRWSSVT